MKNSFIVVLFLTVISCRNHESIESLGEYDVPFEPDVKEKIYTYVRTPGFDTTRHHFRFSFNNDEQLLRESIYYNDMINFERYYRIRQNRKQLMEEYYYEYPSEAANELERVKGDIISYKEIDDGKKYRGVECLISFTN
jgi:hypothetical protein